MMENKHVEEGEFPGSSLRERVFFFLFKETFLIITKTIPLMMKIGLWFWEMARGEHIDPTLTEEQEEKLKKLEEILWAK